MGAYIEDLSDSRTYRAAYSSDCCVIGAGPAGLTLARALAERGFSVIVVERGGLRPREAGSSEPVEFLQDEYRGATIGRAFGWGGTSALWGGQLLPLRAADLEERNWCDKPAWPIGINDIEEHLPTLHRWLGVSESPYDVSMLRAIRHPLAQIDWGEFTPRFSKWIRFSARNLAVAWRTALACSGRVRVILNARVASAEITQGSESRTVAAVHVDTPSGERLQVKSSWVFVAAGALSSTSILQRFGVGKESAEADCLLPGSGFADHLSLRVGSISVRDQRCWNRLFAPFFEGSTMRSLRLEMPGSLLRARGLPALYVHFINEAPEGSGFSALRDLFRGIQKRDPEAVLRSSLAALRSSPEVLRIAWWRFVRGRLCGPAGSRVFVHVDFEQARDAGNWIAPLVDSASDGLRVRWTPGIPPSGLVESITSALEDFWQRNSMGRLAELRLLPESEVTVAWPTNVHDIYHPACSMPMGSGSNAQLDADGKVARFQNLYVASSAAFPSMGAANPTLTIMALALRMAEHIARRRDAIARGGPHSP